MATRRLALLGTEKGPWIATDRIVNPHAKVCGLVDGETITVILCNERAFSEPQMVETVQIGANGLHKLPSALWMRMFVSKPARSTIVEIVSRAA